MSYSTVRHRLQYLLLFLSLLICCGSGCAVKYDYVRQIPNTGSATESEPEITETDRYHSIPWDKYGVVAYRPPDECLDQGVIEAEGKGRPTQTVMMTKCGKWLAELESALAKAVFRVISWQTLTDSFDRKDKKDPINRAKAHGVDIVFMINSLETGVISPKRGYEHEIEFYLSDYDGNKREPVAVDDHLVDQVIESIPKESLIPAKCIAATADVTAIEVRTRESIWFFKQTTCQKLHKNRPWGAYFWCRRGGCHNWEPPHSDLADKKKRQVSSKNNQHTGSKGPPKNNFTFLGADPSPLSALRLLDGRQGYDSVGAP